MTTSCGVESGVIASGWLKAEEYVGSNPIPGIPMRLEPDDPAHSAYCPAGGFSVKRFRCMILHGRPEIQHFT